MEPGKELVEPKVIVSLLRLLAFGGKTFDSENKELDSEDSHIDEENTELVIDCLG